MTARFHLPLPIPGKMPVLFDAGCWNFFVRIRASAIATVVLLSACASAADQLNCDLEKPPKDAVADGDHGYYLFTYPWIASSSYTGCRTTWDERGEKLFLLRLKDGNPGQFLMAGSIPGKLTKTCKYAAGRLLDTAEDCPTYDDIKATLPSAMPDHDLHVPSERDPRR